MKKNKLNISGVVFLLGILISSNTVAYAQQNDDSVASEWELIHQEIQAQGQSVDSLEVAYLEAQSLDLSDTAYAPNAIVEGSVVVRNGGAIAAERIVPAISLVGNFDGPIPRAEYDIDNSQESFSLVPGEKKTIYFSYTLPRVFLSDDLGIKVEFFTDTGLRQDSIVQRFSARGEIMPIEITDASLSLRDRQYGLRATPTVYPENEISLALSIFAEKAVAFTPTISIHDFSSVTGDLVRATEYDSQTIVAGENNISLRVTPTLPDGMFEAVAEFKDEQGIKVVPDVVFLFMKMNGEMSPFRLRNITVADTVNNPDIKNFRVSFTGGAPDIDIFLDNPNQSSSSESVVSGDNLLPSNPASYQGLEITIDVYKEGNRVAGSTMDATLAQDFVIDIPVSMKEVSAGTYLVKASVVEVETGTVREEYSKEMFIKGNDEEITSTTFSNTVLVATGIGLLVVLILILLITAKKRRALSSTSITK